MPKNVYVVYGSSGHYDDKDSWPVKVFRNEIKAQEFVEKVEARYEELLKQYGSDYKIPSGSNEYDSEAVFDDTLYEYDEVPFSGVIETDDINIKVE